MENFDRPRWESLHQRAEELSQIYNPDPRLLSTDEATVLVHELQVRKIELELQNKELQVAQQNVEKSRDRFSHLFHHAPVGYVVLNQLGIIQQVNETFLNMTNYGHDETAGRSFAELLEGEEQNIFRARYKAVLKHPSGKQQETRLRQAEGKTLDVRLEWVLLEAPTNLDEGREIQLLMTISDISRLKEAEAQVRLNEARLQSLFNISQHPADNVQELLDFTLEEAIRLTGSKIGYIYFYSEQKKQFTLNSWSKDVMKACNVREQETVYDLEKTGIWGETVRQRKPILVNDFQASNPLKRGYPEGHVEMTRFLTIPIFNENEIVAVVGVSNKGNPYDSSDIRQLNLLMDAAWKMVLRKRTDEDLRKSEEKFRTTLYSLGDGVITTGLEGSIQQMNPVAETLTGWKEREALGRPLSEILQLINTETGAQVESLISNILQEGRMVVLPNQTELIARNGIARPISSTSTPILSADGKMLGAVLVFRDQTSQKKAEHSLRQAEQKYHLLFENLTTGFALHEMVFDSSGRPCDYRFLDINPAFQQLTGLQASQVIGRTVREVIPTIEDYWIDTYGKVVLSGEPNHYENYNAELGKHYHVLAYRPQPGQFAVLFTDITLQKETEEQIRGFNSELELRVRERTAQLEAANRELEAFSYSVSHDLRTPLRAMDGFSAALLDEYAGQLDEKGQHYLERIQTASQRMGNLINDLLNLSRVTRTEMNIIQVDLGELANEIAGTLQTQYPLRAVEWMIERPLIVRGDPRLLYLMMQNLLDNALKFSGLKVAARIEIGMTLLPSQTEGEQDQLEKVYFVRDNGVGFDMNYAGKLFGAFQRLHAINEFPGTGIGLATVQRIIHRHGGRIWPEATVGEGATFYFTIA